MAKSQSSLRIETAAARLAVELNDLFARELKLAAKVLAGEGTLITAEHYRQAVSTACSKVLRSSLIESENVHRRVA